MSSDTDDRESNLDPQDDDDGNEVDGVGAPSENADEGSVDRDDQSAVASTRVDEEGSHAGGDEDMSEASGGLDRDDDDDGKESIAPAIDGDDGTSAGSPDKKSTASTPPTGGGKKKKKVMPPHARKGRAPAVKGLSIPFRTVKKVH
jgi:hypothetical protein